MTTQSVTAARDLFSIAPLEVEATPQTVDRGGSQLSRPTLPRLIAGGVGGALIAFVFGMPFFPSPSTPLAGVPTPVGALFALGTIALPALRSHRLLQQLLRAVVVALFLAYGLPLLAAPFPADWRFVFFLAMTGTVLALYEWTVPR